MLGVVHPQGLHPIHHIAPGTLDAIKVAAARDQAAMEAIAGNVRVMLCMTGGSVVTMEDCEEYLARLPAAYRREVIRSLKEHRPLDLTSLGSSPM